MKNVHLIEAKQPCRLHYYNYLDHLGLSKENLQWKQGRNIYITSEEDIKEGDLVTDGKLVGYYSFDEDGCPIIKSSKDDRVYGFGLAPHSKKIILTTDQGLIKDGVQAIDDEFLEWFVKNQGCEKVEVIPYLKDILNPLINEKYPAVQHNHFDESKMIFRYYYKIIIPKKKHIVMLIGDKVNEEPKQETLEEAAEIFVNNRFTKQICGDESYPDILASKSSIVESHILFAKWQQEQDKNKYSDEEVKELLKMYRNSIVEVNPVDIIYLDKWFNKFKKK